MKDKTHKNDISFNDALKSCADATNIGYKSDTPGKAGGL